MALKNSVKATAGSSIIFTVISAVGWIMFLGGFGFSYPPSPSNELGSIPYYFTAVVYPVLAILLIGAAIQVLVAPSYKMVQAILMSLIVLFTVMAAVHGGTILNEVALKRSIGQPRTTAMFWGVVIELAALIFSLFFLIDANIYLRD